MRKIKSLLMPTIATCLKATNFANAEVDRYLLRELDSVAAQLLFRMKGWVHTTELKESKVVMTCWKDCTTRKYLLRG